MITFFMILLHSLIPSIQIKTAKGYIKKTSFFQAIEMCWWNSKLFHKLSFSFFMCCSTAIACCYGAESCEKEIRNLCCMPYERVYSMNCKDSFLCWCYFKEQTQNGMWNRIFPIFFFLCLHPLKHIPCKFIFRKCSQWKTWLFYSLHLLFLQNKITKKTFFF